MRFLRGLFAFILILVIIGGIGYIAYSYLYMPGMNHGTGTDNSNVNMNMGHNMGGTANNTNQAQQNTGAVQDNFNTVLLQNKDRLSQLTNIITQAVDMITTDPYSRITLPQNAMDTQTVHGDKQGTTSVNIFPNSSNAITVNPGGGAANTTAAPNTTAGSMAGMAGMNMAQGQNTGAAASGYVYDQAKMEQLHSGIFKLAQGLMTLSQLNDDIILQAGKLQPDSPGYQDYIYQYQITLRNKTKLNNAISLISAAYELVNVNPYASQNGYPYDASYMEKLHSGIFKLAQGMAQAAELNEVFTNQMAQAASAAQLAYNNYGMNMDSMTDRGFSLNSVNLTFVFNLILIILIVTLIISIFGAIGHFLRTRPIKNYQYANNNDRNTQREDG